MVRNRAGIQSVVQVIPNSFLENGRCGHSLPPQDNGMPGDWNTADLKAVFLFVSPYRQGCEGPVRAAPRYTCRNFCLLA